jgi:tetratricopeptide (TPR) repeat protein
MMPTVSGTRRLAVRRAALSIAVLATLAGCTSVTVEDKRDYKIQSESDKSILDSQLRRLNEEVAKYPKRHDLHYKISGIYYQQADFREAVKSLDRAIDLAPDDPTYHYQLGRVYLHMKEIDAAEKEFRKAIALLPADRYTGFHAALGHVLALKKDVAGAVSEFQKCVEIEPTKALYYYCLGSLHDMRGDRERTIHYLTEYLSRGDPTYEKQAQFILERLGVIVEKPAASKAEEGLPSRGSALAEEGKTAQAAPRAAVTPAAAADPLELPALEDLVPGEAGKD